MKIATIALIVLAVLVAAFGFFFLSEPVFGVGVVAIACLLGIFARIAQAAYQHTEQIEKLRAIHFMIRDEIDRAALMGTRNPMGSYATAGDDQDDDDGDEGT